MKKLYSILAAALLVGSMSVNAQEYYPKYYINEDFNGLEALPTGWSGQTTAKYCIFNGNGGYSIADNALKTNGSGSGNRGVDITFPAIDTTMTKATPVIYVEFDWIANALTVGTKNSYGFAFTGTGAIVNTSNWYTPAVFGVYIVGTDKAIHIWNMDPWGSEQTDTTVVTPQWGNQYGPIYQGSATVNSLNRVGTANTNPSALATFVDSINASTRALVLPSVTATSVHFKVGIDFENQKILSFTLTQNDDPSNTFTVENLPFLAPYMIGEDTTVVAREDRIVKDLSIIANVGTKACKISNGSNSNFDIRMDNFLVYYLKQSIGTRDISVKFIDQNGDEAKQEGLYVQQQIGEELIISAEDLVSFSTATAYYAFDAEATLAANPTATSYKTMPVDENSSEFKIVFKKYTKVAGPLTWTGNASKEWNELDANFTAEGVNGLFGYQKGVAVILPESTDLDSILINSTIEMDSANLTINGKYYVGGNSLGKIEGAGKVIVNASTTLNTIIKFGVEVNTTDEVCFINSAAGSAITACDGAQLALTPSASFSIPITGAGDDAKITIIPGTSAKDLEYNMTISNVGTVDYKMINAGRLNGVRFQGSTNATYANATDSTPVAVNVINAYPDSIEVGFGAITKTGLQYANINLDKGARLVRYYNEVDNEVDYFGSLSGAPGSKLESGWVDGRHAYYRVGGLGEDAIFGGDIVSFPKTDSTYTTSVIYLVKEGAGRWDLMGNLAFNGTIEVAAGELAMNNATILDSLPMNWVSNPDTCFATVITSLTVDSAATVYLPKNLPIETVQANTGSTVYAQNTICPGNVQIGGAWTGALQAYGIGMLDATINLSVMSPDQESYQAIVSESDIDVTRSKLNITVLEAATTDIELPILYFEMGSLNMPEGEEGCSVYVNGFDIAANPGATGQGGFAFSWETGQLTCYAGPLGLNNAVKEVASVECYDLLGVRATADSKGILIKKTTFSDGSVSIEKIISVK